jgi:cytochrome P460
MQRYLLVISGLCVVVLVSVFLLKLRPVHAQTQESTAVFDSSGKLKLPTGYRKWVFVGAPLTPEGLNNGKFNCDQPGGCTKSNFPEYHHVYIEQKNVDAYLKTGDFPEGTVIVKELTRVLNPTFPDGSRTEPSGRGYFNGELNGIDVSVKDRKRFSKSNGWGFFTFGHHPLPYAQTAAESPISECAGCHIANVAKTDMTYIKFYPLLRDKDKIKKLTGEYY